MKRIKSYTRIWAQDKVFYAFNDWTLPRPVSLTQIIWFIVFFVLSVVLKGVPPFIFKNSMIMNHIAIPAFIAWYVSKKTFDGKKPFSFLLSLFRYSIRNKTTARNKAIRLKKYVIQDQVITIGKKRKRKDGAV